MARREQVKQWGMWLTEELDKKWKQINRDDRIMNTAGDIFKQVLSGVYYLIDLALPPERRHQILHVAKPYLITAAVVLVTYICLSCCGGRSTAKMMKAPGRSPKRVARASFEANPKAYFRRLRGKE